MKSLKQQELPAWTPLITAGTVVPSFTILGIAFIIVGVGLLIISEQVQMIQFDYTECTGIKKTKSCDEIIRTNIRANCKCLIVFDMNSDFLSSVYIYYGLKNYFQNHRRYGSSVDLNQFMGSLAKPSSSCEPFKYKRLNNNKIPIAPCGIIANSLFNDTFTLWYQNQNGNFKVPLLFTGISWPNDKAVFKNPKGNFITEILKVIL